MAEKGGKKNKGKGDANVLASLPSTRPNRLGRHSRDGADTTAKAATGTRAAPTATKAAGAASKAKATTSPASKPAAKQPAAKPRPRKAAPRKKAAEPTPVASVAQATPQRPMPVRPGAQSLAEPAKKSAGKRGKASSKPPSGTELVTTVVQAAGELASVGLSIGGQIVKRAVERLPKP